MADRFHLPNLPDDGPIVLSGEEARHLARVARKGIGDEVEVFDGRGRSVLAEIRSIVRDRVELAAVRPLEDRAAAIRLHLMVAPPKGDRFDWLVEKAVELGVERLTPLRAERSVVDPRPAKLARLERLIVEASKQSGRSRLMELSEPRGSMEALREEIDGPRLLADAGGAPPTAWPTAPAGSWIALAVGPEGGWTDAERSAARASGWVAADLGPTRLRVETAAVAGAAIALTKILGG